MKFDAYSQRRLELKIASDERRMLQEQGSEKVMNKSMVGSVVTCGPLVAEMLEEQDRESFSEIERIEKKRLEKARNRQKKELLQMLQFEAKTEDNAREIKEKQDLDFPFT